MSEANDPHSRGQLKGAAGDKPKDLSPTCLKSLIFLNGLLLLHEDLGEGGLAGAKLVELYLIHLDLS